MCSSKVLRFLDFPAGPWSHAETSWTPVWRSPPLWHRWLQETLVIYHFHIIRFWYFSSVILVLKFTSRNILSVMKSLVARGAKLSNNGMTKKWNQAIYCVIWWFKFCCQPIWPLFIKIQLCKDQTECKEKTEVTAEDIISNYCDNCILWIA